MAALKFEKLSTKKRAIIRTAYQRDFVGTLGNEREKNALWLAGWLQSPSDANSEQWVLTDKGKAAYEATQQPAPSSDTPPKLSTRQTLKLARQFIRAQGGEVIAPKAENYAAIARDEQSAQEQPAPAPKKGNPIKPFEKLSPKQKSIVEYAYENQRVYPHSAVANHHNRPLSKRSFMQGMKIGRSIDALETAGWLEAAEYGYRLTIEGKAAYEATQQSAPPEKLRPFEHEYNQYCNGAFVAEFAPLDYDAWIRAGQPIDWIQAAEQPAPASAAPTGVKTLWQHYLDYVVHIQDAGLIAHSYDEWLVSQPEWKDATPEQRASYKAQEQSDTPLTDLYSECLGREVESVFVDTFDAERGETAQRTVEESAAPAVNINGIDMTEAQSTAYVTEFALRSSYGAIVSELEAQLAAERERNARLVVALKESEAYAEQEHGLYRQLSEAVDQYYQSVFELAWNNVLRIDAVRFMAHEIFKLRAASVAAQTRGEG